MADGWRYDELASGSTAGAIFSRLHRFTILQPTDLCRPVVMAPGWPTFPLRWQLCYLPFEMGLDGNSHEKSSSMAADGARRTRARGKAFQAPLPTAAGRRQPLAINLLQCCQI